MEEKSLSAHVHRMHHTVCETEIPVSSTPVLEISGFFSIVSLYCLLYASPGVRQPGPITSPCQFVGSCNIFRARVVVDPHALTAMTPCAGRGAHLLAAAASGVCQEMIEPFVYAQEESLNEASLSVRDSGVVFRRQQRSSLRVPDYEFAKRITA